MKCPHKLEPHQIQGMDCIHIYPTIQWLVRKSLETRKQNADYIRSYSTWQFDRIFCDPSKRSDSNDSTRSSIPDYGLLNPIKTSLKRKYYHPNRLKLQDEMLRVKATLLEYEIDGLDRDAITIPHSAEYSNKTLEHSQTDLTSDSERMLLNSMSQTKDDENDMLEISSDTVAKKMMEESIHLRKFLENQNIIINQQR
ncbi:hypothetical protein SSS_07460 [Sarcoptes scabiei]|nr:hypothetical protein SSS_07460 [Sarcoptes scabiei]